MHGELLPGASKLGIDAFELAPSEDHPLESLRILLEHFGDRRLPCGRAGDLSSLLERGDLGSLRIADGRRPSGNIQRLSSIRNRERRLREASEHGGSCVQSVRATVIAAFILKTAITEVGNDMRVFVSAVMVALSVTMWGCGG